MENSDALIPELKPAMIQSLPVRGYKLTRGRDPLRRIPRSSLFVHTNGSSTKPASRPMNSSTRLLAVPSVSFHPPAPSAATTLTREALLLGAPAHGDPALGPPSVARVPWVHLQARVAGADHVAPGGGRVRVLPPTDGVWAESSVYLQGGQIPIRSFVSFEFFSPLSGFQRPYICGCPTGCLSERDTKKCSKVLRDDTYISLLVTVEESHTARQDTASGAGGKSTFGLR